MTSLLLLFPGQGSQSPGMAELLWEFPIARAVFAEAGETLGWDVGELCLHGSMEDLTRTDHTQLAILTCSVATWRLLEEQGLEFRMAAGHSLGEYSALVATGHLTFADALRVVDARARAMHDCGLERQGAMAAIIGLDGDAVDDLCSSLDDVWVANYNSPGQVVVSGSPEGVQAAGEAAREQGAKRVLPLAVSGAFHTPFMAGAAESLSHALAQVTFRAGGSAEGARFFSTTEVRYPASTELAEVMARQLVSPVRFMQSIEAILAAPGAPQRALEVGPGNVLCGLIKRIARRLPAAATATTSDLGEALAAASSAADEEDEDK
ncbi:MAG: ACP S-malonyltransferase [Thermoleophilia bacterium]